MDNNEIFLGKNQGQPTNQHVPQEAIDTEFQVPTTEVELPSQGHFYKDGKKKVKIKFLTASEDDILFSPDLIRAGKSLDTLLQKAVIDKDINPDDMLIGDRNVVLVALRRTGLGDKFQSPDMVCPNCEEVFSQEVDLSKLKLKPLAITPDERGEYEYVCPTINKTIKFRFLTGKDENRLAKIASGGKKNMGANQKVNKIMTERYLLQIMEVEGKRDKILISKFIEIMPMMDSLAFREYVKQIEPNLDTTYGFTCKHCEHEFQDQVVLDYKLFYPNLK